MPDTIYTSAQPLVEIILGVTGLNKFQSNAKINKYDLCFLEIQMIILVMCKYLHRIFLTLVHS